jgi:hypothetical protein
VSIKSTDKRLDRKAALEGGSQVLKKSGHNAKVEVLSKLKHFDVAKYAKPLSKTVRWIKQVWKKAEKAKKK